jgi:cyclophilin family peptidyl-prolyl cis-trans isomerase
VQGGCPRGDGWGDAGWFLRSQFNSHRYERGYVGMAHSGKDTPGSQFFITHLPQPHLDGRYTIIGRVVSGMEIVDFIEVGDTFGMEIIE